MRQAVVGDFRVADRKLLQPGELGDLLGRGILQGRGVEIEGTEFRQSGYRGDTGAFDQRAAHVEHAKIGERGEVFERAIGQ